MKLIKKITLQEGWHCSDSALPIQIGIKHGNSPVGCPHLHKTMTEYFLVLKGSIVVRVGVNDFFLEEGDLLVVEPGEDHALCKASSDAIYVLLMPRAVPDDRVDLPTR